MTKTQRIASLAPSELADLAECADPAFEGGEAFLTAVRDNVAQYPNYEPCGPDDLWLVFLSLPAFDGAKGDGLFEAFVDLCGDASKPTGLTPTEVARFNSADPESARMLRGYALGKVAHRLAYKLLIMQQEG